jgi:hypothetical protein
VASSRTSTRSAGTRRAGARGDHQTPGDSRRTPDRQRCSPCGLRASVAVE